MLLKKLAISFAMCSFAITPMVATVPITDKELVVTENEDPEMGEFYDATDEFEALFNTTGDDIISTAMKYIGRPYRHGTAGPYTFDCSGFTSFVYKNSHISLSRDSRTQYTQGISVNRDQLRRGDLVFFTSPRSGRNVGHVGIVTDVEPSGNFSFVHASRSGIKVDNFAKAKYYHGRYVGAKRILDY